MSKFSNKLLFAILMPFSKDPESKFWKYFQSQISSAEEFLNASEKQTGINQKLNEKFPGIGLGSLVNIYKNGTIQNQIFVTAHGDETKFPIIENLVKKAPKSNNYNIIAYEPPSYLEKEITFNGKSIPSDSIEFTFQKIDSKFNICLFFPILPSITDSVFYHEFVDVLYQFLGEKQYANIGDIDLNTNDKKPFVVKTYKLKELYDIMTSELK